jgi:hypothetical protein
MDREKIFENNGEFKGLEIRRGGREAYIKLEVLFSIAKD